MAAAKRRKAPLILGGLKAGARSAAMRAARDAGMSLDEWVAASVVKRTKLRTGGPKPAPARGQPRAPIPPAPPETVKPAAEPAAKPAVEAATRAKPASEAIKLAADGSKVQDTRPEPVRPEPSDPGKRASAVAPPNGLDAAAAKLKNATRRPARAPADTAARSDTHLERALAAAAAENERRARKQADTTAAALDSVATWIERAEDRLTETSRVATEGQERTAVLLHEALTGLARRLEDIESKVADGGQPSMEAALRAVERIETQLAEASEAREEAQSSRIEAALRGFEERIASISDRVAAGAPRPIGQRGLEPEAEVRSAVDEIRARQAELDEHADHPSMGRSNDAVLSWLRGDIARLAGRLDTARSSDGMAAALAAIQEEVESLQDAIGGLATRAEVDGIERTMHSILAQLVEANTPTEIAALGATVNGLRAEIRRVGENASGTLQARLARDIEILAGRIETAVVRGADPALVVALETRLVELRRAVAEMADPQHVRSLEAQIVALNDRLNDLSRRRDEFGDLGARIDALARKLDRFGETTRAGPENLRATIESAPLLTSLVQRLDRLDEVMRRPAPAPSPELRSIEDMLQALVERVDQAERPGADYGALDALEQQVAALAERLERNAGADPTLIALERAMGHLMTQVASIREGAFEAAERAATAAVRDTADALPGGEPPEFGVLKRDLADLRAHHSAADQRTRATLESVGAALEKVVARIGTLEQETVKEAPRPGPEARQRGAEAPSRNVAPAILPIIPVSPTLSETVKQAEAEASTKAKTATNPVIEEADRPVPPAGSGEILLEPGAGRPRPKAPPSPGDAAGKNIPPDIRANLIAAARRAAQSAAAEAANSAKKVKRAHPPIPGGPSLAARMVQALDKKRRPILFGLAAIVLTLGAVQTIGGLEHSDTTASGPAPAEGSTEVASAEPPRTAAPAAGFAEPKTTQALAAPKPSEAASAATDAKPFEVAPAAGSATPASARQGASLAALPSPEQGGAARSEAKASSAPETSAKTEADKGEAKTPAAATSPSKVDAKLSSEPPLAAKADPKTPAFVAAAAPQPPQPSPSVTLTRAADQRLSSEPRAPFERIASLAAMGGDIPSAIGVPGLRQAALAGDPAAVYDLAARAAEGRGLPRDLKLAAKLFEAAALHGLVPAQYRIGNHYEKGLGVPRDIALAKAWYQSAADKGNARAMHNLAVILAEGSGGKPDYAAAAEWFRRAADLGVRDSQFNLAVLFGRGLGVKQDLGTSYTWFSIAAARGDEDAGKKRDEVGARLTATELASARKLAEAWKVDVPNRATNEVTLPAGGWSESQPTATTTNVKAAPAGRSEVQPAAATTKSPSASLNAAQPAAANVKGPVPGKGVRPSELDRSVQAGAAARG